MLKDQYGRSIEYLRISLIDKCDLRCSYCIPEGYTDFQDRENWLSFDQIEQIVRVFSQLGTRRFRLTGGEPLLRKNIVDLVARLRRIERVQDLSLSTNATQLARFAQPLRDAGLDRINVSLDALSDATFHKITGNKNLHKVLEGLEAARQAQFERIKVNMVVMKDTNEDQIGDLFEYCIERGFILRLIELMPMGITGQKHEPLNLQPVIQELADKYDLKPSDRIFGGGPARYWETADHRFSIGYITPISQHFCANCNRVRLSADGTLYMCLGNDHQYDVGSLVKAGISDEELAQHLRKAIDLKPLKHEFVEKPKKVIRIMATTGG